MFRQALPVSIVLSVAAGAVSAQQPIRINFGETVTDYLSASDDSLSDGSRFKLYYFEAASGDSITIYMSSQDFNVQLLLADSVDDVLAADDNSGGDCNSYITSVLPADGFYAIYATAAAVGELGQYQLSLMKGIQPPQGEGACAGFLMPEGMLSIGDSVEGSLGEGDRTVSGGSFFEVWALEGTAGRTFTVDLRSPVFDSRLILLRGFLSSGVLALDDDGGGGCDARVTHSAEDQRQLRIVVMSAGDHRPGPYTLTITEGTKPPPPVSPCQIAREDDS